MATPPKLCGDCGTQMEVMPELYALPGLDPTPNGLQFNLNRAVPITVYICPSCGRFKFMSALMLGNVALPQPSAQQQVPQGMPQGVQGSPQAVPQAAQQGNDGSSAG